MSSPKKTSPKKKKQQELNADGTKKKAEPKFVPMQITQISKGIHPSSAQSWGAGACAKLFSHVVEANDGRAYEIIRNQTSFLDLYTPEQLAKPTDEIGNTMPFLCVYHDRPDMLRYLYARGVDLGLFNYYRL
jgi:hypothetical protein